MKRAVRHGKNNLKFIFCMWEITCSLGPASVDLQDCIRLPSCNIGSDVILRDCSMFDCGYTIVYKKYWELATVWSKRLGGHQQVPAAIFLSSDVKHLRENPDLPHLFRRLWDPKDHRICISRSISAFYLRPMHLYALHRKVKVIPALTFKLFGPTPAY